MSRAAGGVILLLLALAAWVFSVGFGLNGSQYDSWVTSLAVMALGLLVAAILVLVGAARVRVSGPRAAITVVAWTGVIFLAMLTTQLYPDSYEGDSSQAHTLAWLGLGVFAVDLFSVLVPKGLPRQ